MARHVSYRFLLAGLGLFGGFDFSGSFQRRQSVPRVGVMQPDYGGRVGMPNQSIVGHAWLLSVQVVELVL